MKEERVPHTRSPFTGGDDGWWSGDALEPRRRAQPQGCGGQSGAIPAQRIRADQHSPAREACLLTRRGERGWELRLGLRSERTESTGVDGMNTAPRLTGRESGEKSGPAEEARDFSFTLCFLVREERGLRALLKGAPEMEGSEPRLSERTPRTGMRR